MKHRVKALDLSKVESDISGNAPRVDGIYKETSGYSITPRTFESRTLLKSDFSGRIASNLESLNIQKVKLQKVLSSLTADSDFQDAENLGVAKGVITGAKTELAQSKNLQKVLVTLKSKQSAVSDLISQFEQLKSSIGIVSTEIFFQDQYQHLNKSEAGVGPVVHRLGINFASMQDSEIAQLFDSGAHYVPSAASTASKTDMKVKLQHPLELFLLEDAVQYLKVNATKTAILLDILVRDDEGKIIMDSSKKPEVHTIVLCKTPKTNEYLVIDPSKVSHSSHIAGIGIHERDFSIIIPKISDIYTGPKDKIGPKPDQFRDCIDIAVKLAFGFEAMQGNSLDSESLASHEVVQMVSNNPDLDKVAPTFVTDIPLRVKQRSDLKIIKQFYEVEKLLSLDYQLLKVLCSKSRVELESTLKDSIQSQVFSEDRDVLRALFDEHTSLAVQFSQDFDKKVDHVMELIGISTNDGDSI